MQSNLKESRIVEIKVVARRLRKISYKIPPMGNIDSRWLGDDKLMDILTISDKDKTLISIRTKKFC